MEFLVHTILNLKPDDEILRKLNGIKINSKEGEAREIIDIDYEINNKVIPSLWLEIIMFI